MLLVVAAALLKEGRVLVQQRPAGKSMAGLWEFPGGKVETGEFPEEALARELTEELGIGVAPGHLLPVSFETDVVGDRALLLLLFRAEQWKGEPVAIEAPAIRWVGADDLRALAMPPADLPLVDALIALDHVR